jgi:membrane-bound serine protease (ClpP class)
LLRKREKSRYGPERLLRKVGEVKEWRKMEGHVFVDGELWKAVSEVPLKTGDEVIIQKIEALTVRVCPAHSKEHIK